ncbi:MAG: 16S rRNA (guanine(527)-N(7))-methyltransferase RsmG [Prevotella sp.]
MNEILKYFPHLSEEQQRQYAALYDLYSDWNSKINVISRKDIDNLYEHHILHSLAIAKFIGFKAGTNILDFGTGGGFPGIPLAIMLPEVNFKLIYGTGTKIKVATEIAKAIGLKNVVAEHLRGEDEREKYDFIVSRAVMQLSDMIRLMRKNISRTQHNALPNGFITLKGGDLTEETKPYKNIANVLPLSEWFEEDWFKGKNIIYIPC